MHNAQECDSETSKLSTIHPSSFMVGSDLAIATMRPHLVILAYLLREARCGWFRPVGTDRIAAFKRTHAPLGTCIGHYQPLARWGLANTRTRRHRCAPSVIPTRKHLHNMATLTSIRTYTMMASRQQLNDPGSDVVIIEWAAIRPRKKKPNSFRSPRASLQNLRVNGFFLNKNKNK